MRITLIILFALTVAFGQKRVTKETVTTCDSLMNLKKYEEVVSVTKNYLKDNGKSEDSELIVPYLMEASVHLEEYKRFDKLLKNYVKRFPESDKLTRLYYLSGIVNAKKKMSVEAVLDFSVSEAYSNSAEEKMKVKKNVDLLGRNHLNLTELETLKEENLAPVTRESIRYWTVIKMKNSNTVAADSLSAEFKLQYPATSYDLTLSLSPKREDQPVTKFQSKTLALMAPLSGNNARLGKEALNTVTLALKEHEDATGEKISLVVVDTKGSPVVTATKTAELIDRKVTAIVGPIMSNTATVTAAMLMDHPEIVMITPTATDDGIAALGKNIFQLNLTTKALADKIASYSIQGLGIKEFAILAPISDYGRLMTDYFTTAVLNLGGEVIYSDYFTPSAHDHRAQFEALRQTYADKKFGAVDSGVTLTSIERKERAAFLEDSTIAIGALFMPVMAENAVKLAAEVPFYKIQTQLLGSNGWKNNTLILDGDRYVNGAVFSAGYTPGTGNAAWQKFNTSYETANGQMPGQLVAPLVYDASKLLIKALQNSGSGSEVSRKLWVTAGYQGLSGEISLDNDAGVNSGAVIQKVSGGKFIRLQ